MCHRPILIYVRTSSLLEQWAQRRDFPLTSMCAFSVNRSSSATFGLKLLTGVTVPRLPLVSPRGTPRRAFDTFLLNS